VPTWGWSHYAVDRNRLTFGGYVKIGPILLVLHHSCSRFWPKNAIDQYTVVFGGSAV
jgi:hypothetical protein